VLHDHIDLFTMLTPVKNVRKSWVLSQFFPPNSNEQFLPVTHGDRAEGYIPISSLVHIKRCATQMGVSHAFRSIPSHQKLDQLWEQEKRTVLHGDIHPFSLPRPVAQL